MKFGKRLLFCNFKYDICKFFINIKYYIIRKLIGTMPVIANCTIYDDIFEYNFGKTRTYKYSMCYNNRIKSIEEAISREVMLRRCVDKGISRTGNSFVLNLN